MKELVIKVPGDAVNSVEKFLETIGGTLEEVRYTSSKEKLIEEIKEAVKEINLVKAGKRKARNADDFINEL